MIRTALKVTCSVRASEITEARIGPTQGVQSKPKERPIANPGKKLELFDSLGVNLGNLAKRSSTKTKNLGIKSDNPKKKITMIENNLKVSADIPKVLTNDVRNKVKNVKLAIKPTIIPIGRALPLSWPPTVEVKIIGKIGNIQGERIVTIPAIKAKEIKVIIF